MVRHDDNPQSTPAIVPPVTRVEPETDPPAKTDWRHWQPSADGTTPILDQLLTEHGGHL